jgi:transposase
MFCVDLDATQMALMTGLNRKTVNALLLKIRVRIQSLCADESCFHCGEVEVDESYFGPRRVKGKRGRGAGGKTIVFGMKKRDDKVYTQIVKNCSAETLVPIIKEHAPDDCTLYSDEWKGYDGLVNAGYKKHYRVKHSDNVFANGHAHVNGIESFWGVVKTRLARYRGLKRKYFELHLKETEFRFNHRHDDLYHLLLKEFRKHPL